MERKQSSVQRKSSVKRIRQDPIVQVEEDGAFMVEEYKDPIDVIQTQIDQSHLSQSYLASQT